MTRLSGLHWRVGTRALTRDVSQTSQDHQTAMQHFGTAQENKFEGCAERWQKDADHRKYRQDNSRSNETIDSQDKIASGPRKNKKDAAATASGIWEPMESCSSGTWTRLPRSNGLAIGAVGDRKPSKKCRYASTVTSKETFLLLRTRSRILRCWRDVEQLTHFEHLMCFPVTRRIKVVFRIFCCAAIFISIVVIKKFRPWIEASRPLVCKKAHHCRDTRALAAGGRGEGVLPYW